MRSLYDALNLVDPAAPLPEPTPEPEGMRDVPPQSAKEFCLAIVNSSQYRKQLLTRILFNELPPAIELFLLSHAYGKPVEHVKLDVRDHRVPSVKELADQAHGLLQAVQEVEEDERMMMKEAKTVNDDGTIH